MSYASIAAHNAPSPSEQPHPDTALLNLTPPTSNSHISTTSKVNLVSPHFKEQLDNDNDQHTFSSIPSNSGLPNLSKGERRGRQHSQKSLTSQNAIGGLLGIVNVGIFGLLGRSFFLRPHLQKDAVAILTSVGGSIALLAAQNHLLDTLGIQSLKIKDTTASPLFAFLAMPLTYKSITGLNSVIVGLSIGLASCADWSRPSGKKLISGLLVGVLALWGAESYTLKRKEEDD